MTTQTITYEELCERARLAAQSMDKGRWQIGDLACNVETAYGKRLLDDFAREINVPKESVKTYRTVARFYHQTELRYAFLDEHPNMTFTHMRYAMRLKTLDKAYDFLELASTNGYTTDEAAHEITKIMGKPTPAKIFDGLVTVSFTDGWITFDAPVLLTSGATYRVVISEVSE